MNILQIAPRLPYPADTGGKIDILNFAKALSKQHVITLVCYCDAPPPEKAILELKQYYSRIKWVLLPPDSKIKMLWQGLTSFVPYTMQKYSTPEMHHRLKAITQGTSFDFIRIDQMHMAWYSRYFKETPVILRKQNVDTVIMQRFYEQQRNPAIKAYAYLQWKKLQTFEHMACKDFKCCAMITHEDERVLKEICPEARTVVIPCGMDIPVSEKETWKPVNPNRLTFLGSLDWLPNEDAVHYFMKEIWPTIRQQIPSIELYVIGRNPSPRIRSYGSQPGVTITGYVEDVKLYLLNTGIFIVPLRIGSGMRIKILEAMSLGVPIITTSIGVEGIDIEPGNDLLVADSPESFINSIYSIFNNTTLSETLSRNSRAKIQSSYSQDSIRNTWTSIIQPLIERKSTRS